MRNSVIDFLEGGDEVVEAEEEALLVVALLPLFAVRQPEVRGYLARFRKVDQPDADFLVVVDHENTAADHL